MLFSHSPSLSSLLPCLTTTVDLFWGASLENWNSSNFWLFVATFLSLSRSLASTDADDDDDVEKFIYFTVVRSRGRNLSMSGMSWDNLYYCAIPSRILFWIILEITKISKCRMLKLNQLRRGLKFHLALPRCIKITI